MDKKTKRVIVKITLFVLIPIVIFLLLFVGAVYLLFTVSNPCGFAVLKTYPIAKTGYSVSLLEEGCGATTKDYYHITILKNGEVNDDKKGIVTSLEKNYEEKEPEITVKPNGNLVIYLDKDAVIEQEKTQYKNIQISYIKRN